MKNDKTTNNVTDNNTKKGTPMVTGFVSFYGRMYNYKHDGKEYVLAIENPVFSGITEESVSKMYNLKNNPDVGVAKMYESILKGDTPSTVYFRSKYDVESVWYNGKLTDIADIPDFSLNEARIKMTVNKSYVGKICLLENGVPYNPFED